MAKYILDKRILKKKWKLYGLYMLIALPFMCLVAYLTIKLPRYACIGLTILTGVIIMLLCAMIHGGRVQKDNKNNNNKGNRK